MYVSCDIYLWVLMYGSLVQEKGISSHSQKQKLMIFQIVFHSHFFGTSMTNTKAEKRKVYGKVLEIANDSVSLLVMIHSKLTLPLVIEYRSFTQSCVSETVSS